MKIKWLFTVVAFSFSLLSIQAKGKLKLKLGVETGYQLYLGEHLMPQSDESESSVSDANNDRPTTNYNPLLPTSDETYMHCFFAGVNGEILWHRERYGILTGARLTQMVDVYDFDENMTVSSDEGEEEMIRSSQLVQHVYYWGVPVEFRLLATRPGRPCRFYFKMGSSWNFLLATSNLVKTTDPVTGERQEERPDNVGRKPDYFMGTLYPAIGCRFFRQYPLLNVEFHLPSFIINMPTSYFAYNIGVGLNVSVQFPTDRKAYDSNRPMGEPYY
ncbi:MAG: hypothetical protein MJZ28_01475 [Paludibacteraceae bacterium]|nr:hypothetical protein [Paludibacteraceae bacterium]